MKKCKHKNRHTELIKGNRGIIYGNIIHGIYSSFETPAINSVINIYCVDCGKNIKSTQLNDYIKQP